jgi:uncharacterized protein with HEPN domain
MRDDRERLLDIKEAIGNIKKYSVKGRRTFEEEELVQNWIIHHLQIIGEAAVKISDDFQEQHPDIPWPKIIGMRNILVHDYFRIDINAVWAVVENDIPQLEQQIELFLQE